MRTVNLLLANSERTLNQLIETVVMDACWPQATVERVRVARIEDFVRQGCSDDFQLIVLVMGNLLPALGQEGPRASFEDALEAVRKIRHQTEAPIIALSADGEHELPLLEAGVDGVIGLPFSREQLGAEVRGVLRLRQQRMEYSAPGRFSMA